MTADITRIVNFWFLQLCLLIYHTLYKPQKCIPCPNIYSVLIEKLILGISFKQPQQQHCNENNKHTKD